MKEMDKQELLHLLRALVNERKVIISVAVDDDPYYSGDGLCDNCELDEEGNLVLCVTI